jgi:hypothetical protein
VRDIAVEDDAGLLRRIAGTDPRAVLHDLMPKAPIYLQLMKAHFGWSADRGRAAGGLGSGGRR